MKPVGLIANPSSGKDIRRLVAYGSVFGNQEKINIIRRVLKALDSIGVEEVLIMPDYACLGLRALDDLDVSLKVCLLEMEAGGTQDDSTTAAAKMVDREAACIITLGGDGTNRVVAKTCGETPLVPISTGTNNVFPQMVEGTLAGLAAGSLAVNEPAIAEVCGRRPRLEIYRDEELIDLALVDVVVASGDYLASRAIWEVGPLKEIFLTRSRPGAIGFSSLGGFLCPLAVGSGQGLHVSIGPGRQRVKAPIAPGMISWLPIRDHRVFGPEEVLPIAYTPSIVALDGEPEILLSENEKLTVRLNPQGPLVVDIEKTLAAANQKGCFVSDQC